MSSFSMLWLGRLIKKKKKKDMRVKMNFHYQPLTVWCKCVYHISQEKCCRKEWKVLKYHLILWVVEIVKSTQINMSVSYHPWISTSKLGWVPETSSLILSFYSVDDWERTGGVSQIQKVGNGELHSSSSLPLPWVILSQCQSVIFFL